MRTAGRDKWWLLGGLVVALLLLGVAWQFFISGQNDKTNSIKADVAAAQDAQLDANLRLKRLKADSVNLKQYQAALAAAQQALPADADIPAFLRQVHAAADNVGVTIIGIQVVQPKAVQSAAPAAAPSASATAGSTTAAPAATGLYQMAITLTANGAASAITDLLKQLQQVQPRAVLLTSVTEGPGTGAGQVTVQVAMQAFIAPADGSAPTVAPTTDTDAAS